MITENEFNKRMIAYYEDESLWARPKTEELRSLIKKLIDFTVYPLDDAYLNSTIAYNILWQLEKFKEFNCLDLTVSLLARYSPFILVYLPRDLEDVPMSKGIDIYWLRISQSLKHFLMKEYPCQWESPCEEESPSATEANEQAAMNISAPSTSGSQSPRTETSTNIGAETKTGLFQWLKKILF